MQAIDMAFDSWSNYVLRENARSLQRNATVDKAIASLHAALMELTRLWDADINDAKRTQTRLAALEEEADAVQAEMSAVLRDRNTKIEALQREAAAERSMVKALQEQLQEADAAAKVQAAAATTALLDRDMQLEEASTAVERLKTDAAEQLAMVNAKGKEQANTISMLRGSILLLQNAVDEFSILASQACMLLLLLLLLLLLFSLSLSL